MLNIENKDLTEVYNLAAKIIDYYRENLQRDKINASGRLSSTADFDISYDDYSMSVYFILESYYWYIEKGRNRSTGKYGSWLSKYTDIQNWLRDKIKRGSFLPSAGHTIPRTPKEIKRVSYAIVHKITKYGFYGTGHYGLNPLERALTRADIDGTINQIINIVVNRFYGLVDIEIDKI